MHLKISNDINTSYVRNPLPNVINRDETIDVLKGLAILLMIIGHCISPRDNSTFGLAIRNMIYSFHMPLFFLIGGLFYKGNLNIKKDARRLLVPYLFTGLVLLFVKGIEAMVTKDIELLRLEIIKVLLGSTWYPHTNLIFKNIPSVGAIYFLFALFWCRVTYGLLYKALSEKKILLGICCLILSTLAVINDNYFVHFPWSINAGISCVFYFYIGHFYVKDVIYNNKYRIRWCYVLILLAFWVLLVYFFSPMDMAGCFYRFFYASILCACLGSYLLWLFAKLISKNRLMSKILSMIGLYTLPILCMHCLQRRLLLTPFQDYSFWGQLCIAWLFALGLTFICTNTNDAII